MAGFPAFLRNLSGCATLYCMNFAQSQEVTIEEVGEEALDLGPYELVRCEVEGRFIVVVVREKPRTTSVSKP